MVVNDSKLSFQRNSLSENVNLCVVTRPRVTEKQGLSSHVGTRDCTFSVFSDRLESGNPVTPVISSTYLDSRLRGNEEVGENISLSDKLERQNPVTYCYYWILDQVQNDNH